MQIAELDTPEAVAAVQDAWAVARAADPSASVFLSGPWLSGWLRSRPPGWRVLAALDDGDPVAFFPVEVRDGLLRAAGHPMADYTGFVCPPRHEDAAIAAFGAHLCDMAWSRLELREVADPRIERLAAAFRRPRYGVELRSGTPCPRIALPPKFDEYLAQTFSSRRRKQLRYEMRRMAALPGFASTLTDPARFEHDVAVLLALWQDRWGPRAQPELDALTAIFRSTLEAELLRLRIYWSGDEPIAALAAFFDPLRRTAAHYIGGYAAAYANLAPGRAVILRAIESAIERGYDTFDFLRGDEPYKAAFGAEPRVSWDLFVERRSLRRSVARLLRPRRAAS